MNGSDTVSTANRLWTGGERVPAEPHNTLYRELSRRTDDAYSLVVLCGCGVETEPVRRAAP